MNGLFKGKGMLLALVATLAMAVPAAADVIQLTGVGGNHQGGVYTVPYYVSVNHGASLTVMCDDYTHDVVVGETWQGTVFSYSDLATHLTQTRAGASIANGGLGLTLAQAQQDYREIFWLFSQFEANPSNANSLNFAAWAIFDPALIGNTGAGWTTGANSAAYWLSQAQLASNWSTLDTTGYFIISPDNLLNGGGTDPHQGSSPQEYVGHNHDTPEPASLALLGSGMLGLGAFIRRKLS